MRQRFAESLAVFLEAIEDFDQGRRQSKAGYCLPREKPSPAMPNLVSRIVEPQCRDSIIRRRAGRDRPDGWVGVRL